MNIPHYWASASAAARDRLGKPLALKCWRWSGSSREEALRQAREALERAAGKVARGEALGRYGYSDRPFREEILEEIRDGRGALVGVITRNAYGVLVLNAAGAMFIDIDFPPRSALESLRSLWQRARGSREEPQETAALAAVRRLMERNSGWGARVYRTRAGLRCLLTHATFDPTAASTGELMRRLGADPLYARLCVNQACFRARLTPKPWRCGASKPPSRYPWEDPGAERRYRDWQQRYEAAADSYATCRLIETLGTGWTHPDIQRILPVHDGQTRVGRPLALA
jgi:hypothetical protein